jgi:hypothetical protein
LPDRDTPSSAPPKAAFAVFVFVTIDVHGSLDRVKDASPFEEHEAFDGCMRLYAHADGVPLLGVQRTPGVAGAIDKRGGDLFRRVGPA